MNTKELADLLNGREYRNEMTRDEEASAKEHGLVVVFGASDDLMEFRGAIHDEVSAWEGGTAYLDSKGLIESKCDCECPYFLEAQSNAAKIKALWGKDEYAWVYETTIPHETFEVLEDEETYCKGIVFSLSDVTA
jgi:hypothetical protein